MHLADAFIQSDLQSIQDKNNFVLLTQCSTTEPQEHTNTNTYKYNYFIVNLWIKC